MHHQLTSSDKRTTALAAIAGVANGTGKSANLRDFFSEAYRELHIEKHFKTFLSIFYEMCTVRAGPRCTTSQLYTCADAQMCTPQDGVCTNPPPIGVCCPSECLPATRSCAF